jgi:hypothetical protein
MAKWEYITLTRNIEYKVEGILAISRTIYEWSDENQDENKMGFSERLNILGEQGWELVSAFPESSYESTSHGTTTSIKLIFKRSK